MSAFEALDPEKALVFYHIPCIFIASQGAVAATDAETCKKLISGFMGRLREQNFLRNEVVGLNVNQLSPILAICSGTFIRIDKNEKEINRFGFNYTMRNDGSWKIVVAALF
ncbi:MAG: hypothetical protein C5B52_01700 [Bacteroidetes bacterium]|nr:MAG: hypothetical protein C5B52_01700 [Bacteroidota bacterium]